MQQLHPRFAKHSSTKERYTREVAIRPAEIGDDSLSHRIADFATAASLLQAITAT